VAQVEVMNNVQQEWEEQVSLVDQVRQDIHKVDTLHITIKDIHLQEQEELQDTLVDTEVLTEDQE
jgi:hypothetical protein